MIILALISLGAVSAVSDSSADDNSAIQMSVQLDEIAQDDTISNDENIAVNQESVLASDEGNDELNAAGDVLAGGNDEILSDDIISDENNHVITNETYSNYFDDEGYLKESVSNGATLDFQGNFIGKYPIYINKSVNVISSTGDAYFDAGASYAGNAVNSINIVAGADNTNVTGLKLHNIAFYVTDASHVTVDDLHSVADLRGVGSSTGFFVFRNAAQYGVLKNSYLENGGTTSSVIVIGFGASHVTLDNNVINITGTSGNILGANAYVGSGVSPDHMRITNNLITSSVTGSATMYGITLVGSYNLVENNTLNFKGSGIIAANMQWAPTGIPRDPQENNTYKNNTFIGASMSIVAGCVVEDNIVEDATFTVSGANVQANNNFITGAVTIAAAATNTTFTNNHVKNTVTVNSNNNSITGNKIASTGDYAIDLKSTSNNVVEENILSSKDKMGDEAVKYAEGKENSVKENGKNAVINIDAVNSWIGNKNNVTVTVVNATGSVTLIINNKEYEALSLENNKATFEINASDINAGLNYVTVTYGGSEEIAGESKDATFYGLDNVVFSEVFFEFFDSTGLLKEDVPYSELIFKGSFSKPTSSITINKPVSIINDGATLSQMAIIILSEGVKIDGLTLTTTTNSATSALGDLIHVEADDVTLSNLKITYKVTRGDYDAIAINVVDSDNVNILNNTIVFSSVISSDSYSANAINLEGVTNSLVDNNTITSTLPALYASNYDMTYFMMGLNTVNPIRMREVEDSIFSRNTIDSTINNVGQSYPTIQSLFIIGSRNVLFDSNSFRMVDTKSKSGSVIYLYAFNFGYDENITVLNNDFYVSTTSGMDASGTAYALQGVESEVKLIGNNITTVSNGPNLGFYVASMMGGSSEIYLEGNVINVTGYATSTDSWALISGMEITNGNAKIYNNTIYTYNKAGYIENAPVYGVSYAQWMSGQRSLDIQDNTMHVQGDYTVFILSGTPAVVTGNKLYAHELLGDDSVAPGIDGIVSNNIPCDPEIIIDGQTAWTGYDSVIKVIVPNAIGNVTIKIGNKTFEELQLVDGEITQDIGAENLIVGANEIIVTYNGDLYLKPGESTGSLQVLDGVITNETFKYYFDEDNNNYLVNAVPEGATLDFQGLFVSDKYTLYINKPVNVISSTNDATFDSQSNDSARKWVKFNVVAGADNTNITGISIINGDLFIQGVSHVTVDNIYMKANMSGVGSGTGFASIHSNAFYTTVKNSYFENGGTGSSILVLGKGGKYATFDNNVFNVTGSSGNILSSNVFVGTGENPEFVNYTNNKIYSHVSGSSTMYGITVCGQGNLIENNTLINMKGNGIVNQYGATSTNNIYRNNVITGGGSMAVGTYSLVENNNISATVTITEGCTVTGNEFNGLTVSGKNTIISNNIINGAVTINSAATNTTLKENEITGTVTVNSNGNTITSNNITGTGQYAIDLKSTKDNNVTSNRLIAESNEGSNAVKSVEGNNIVKDNYRLDADLIVSVEDIDVGQTAIVNVSINKQASGTVDVIVNGKKYTLAINDGATSVEIPNLSVSTYNVAVHYKGDSNVLPSENYTSFTVSKIKSDAVITTSDLNIGEDVVVTITIAGATGDLTVTTDVGKKVLTLDNGSATFTFEDIKAGNHYVTVVYRGDSTHDLAVNSTTFTIEKLPSEIALENITVNAGEAVPINFTIAQDATGRVIIDVNGSKTIKYLVNGTIDTTLNDLAYGVYTVIVSYDGDEMYAPSTKTIQVTVNGFNADLKANASDIKVGEDAVINITADENVNGKITIEINDQVIPATFVNGKASVKISNLTNGTYNAIVKFAGDKKYIADEVTVTFTVSKAKLPSDINISTEIPEGTTAPEFSINLPSDATGKFTVTVDGENYTEDLVNGSATVKVPELSVGNHTISSSYSGDNKYAGFASENTTLNVPKASIPGGEDALNMTTPADSSTPSYSIKLNPDAKGNLTVVVDGKDTYTQPLENGSATVTVPELASGKHSITVTYTGDTKYSSISKNTTVNVPEKAKPVTPTNKVTKKPTKIIAKKKTFKAKTKVKKYTITLKSGKKPVKKVKVTLKIKGKTYKAKTNAKGKATFKIKKLTKKGKVKAVIKFKGNKNYKASSKKVKLTIKK